jgi:hypothetical protein
MRPPVPEAAARHIPPGDHTGFKDALLADVRRHIGMAYNTLVTQAQQIAVSGDTITLTFAPSQKIGPTFEKYKVQIEALAVKIAGRKMTLLCDNSGSERTSEGAPAPAKPADTERKNALKERAMADEGVQALLEVFPAEIRDVEEM